MRMDGTTVEAERWDGEGAYHDVRTNRAGAGDLTIKALRPVRPEPNGTQCCSQQSAVTAPR